MSVTKAHPLFLEVTCAPVVLESLPLEAIVRSFLFPGNAKPCADKKVLFHYLPNFQNIFDDLLYP